MASRCSVRKDVLLMPNKQAYYEPDQIDCDNLSSAIRGDFRVNPTLEVTFSLDMVLVVCRCYVPAIERPEKPIVQALSRFPLKARRSLYVAVYAVLLDCWHQMDRGVLAAADRPMPRDWSGRPRTPARRA